MFRGVGFERIPSHLFGVTTNPRWKRAWIGSHANEVTYRTPSHNLGKTAATCPHVLPERLLHKRLPRGAQPFRRHHQRSTGLREWSKCVSFEAPKWMCRVLCKEDLPELQKVVLACVMVHVRMFGVQAEFGKPGTAARELLCRCPGRMAPVTFRQPSGGSQLQIGLG